MEKEYFQLWNYMADYNYNVYLAAKKIASDSSNDLDEEARRKILNLVEKIENLVKNIN